MADILSVELIVEDGAFDAILKKNEKKLENFGQNARPKVNFSNVEKSLDELEKQSNKTRQSFEDIVKTRLDAGNVNNFTKELFRSQEQARQLLSVIQTTRTALSQTTDKSLIKIYLEDLKAAETELGQLQRKQQAFLNGQNRSAQAGAPPASLVESAYNSNAFLSGLTGGLIGGGIVATATAGFNILEGAISSTLSTAKELSEESVRLAANFEETTNSIAVFAGGTLQAGIELDNLDNIALKTNGLRLESAEDGLRRLRALGFEAKTAQNFVVGLGIARLKAGTSEQNVNRVITHFEQIAASPETAARDFKFSVRDLPTLRASFKDAFGTADYKELQKLVQANPEKFFEKLAFSMANAQQAEAGLNIAIEKGKDALVQAGREFGKPLLSPLTRDVKDLTDYLNENADTFQKWGQYAADAIQGVSDVGRGINEAGNAGNGAGYAIGKNLVRGSVAVATYGVSEAIFGITGNLQEIGRQAREKQELAELPGKVAKGADFGGRIMTIDPLTNTLVEIKKTVQDTPSLEKALDLEKAAKEAEKVRVSFSEIALKNRGGDLAQNLELNKARILRDYKDDSLQATQKTGALEVQSLRDQIALADELLKVKLKNLTPEESAAGKGLLLYQENAAEIGKLNNQILVTQTRLQSDLSEKAKALKTDFSDFIIAGRSTDNPLVKLFSDIDTVGERAQKRFGSLGQEAVKLAANLETANLQKQLNLQLFQNNSEALRFDQQARKLAATPDTQFADFQRRIDLIERNVDFIAQGNDLTRRVNEAGYYANQFNRNNPKSFAEYNRDSYNEDLSASGQQIKNAVKDIMDLRSVSVGESGVYGRNAVAEKILSLIPSRAELLRRLDDPRTRGDAQFLLSQQFGALTDSRAFQRQKFGDFLETQKTLDFGKQFAREQIALINKSGLTDIQKAQQRLSVTDALGNDLDAGLKRGRISDFFIAQKDKLDKENEGRRDVKELKNLVAGLVKQLTGKGIKIDGDGPSFNLEVTSKDAGANLTSSPTNADTRGYYDPNFNFRDGGGFSNK